MIERVDRKVEHTKVTDNSLLSDSINYVRWDYINQI